MEQQHAQEYPPEIPFAIKSIAWIILLYLGFSLVGMEILIVKTTPGESVFRYLGHIYLMTREVPKAAAMALIFVTHSFVIASAAFTLKGRMWAYHALIAAGLLSMPATIVNVLTREIDTSLLWIAVLWVLVRNYGNYREFAHSHAAKPA